MLRNNIVANFLGQVWPSLLGILLVPVYLRYLGVEAYGLVGFFASLQALISFLDFGLSTTANREIAFGLASPSRKKKVRNLLRTLELVNGLVALFILSVFFLAGDWLAREWINSKDLSYEIIRSAAVTFGLMIALRWPVSIYNGVLRGANRQVLQNVLYMLIVSLRGIGSAIVVAFVAPTVLAYLTWQVAMAFVELIVMSWAAWRSLKSDVPHTPVVDFKLMKEIWKFSISLGATSLAAALLKQLDRVFLTKILDLRQVGYYTAANAVYSSVGPVADPIATAAFPRFTALIAEKNETELAKVYHRTTQYTAFIVSPISAILYFFSYEILFIWTGSYDVASNAAPVLSILSLAAVFNAMMKPAFRLQLAAGFTSIVLWSNVINLLLLGPLMYYFVLQFEIAGAGIAWLIFNVLYYLFVPQIMHRRLLQTEKMIWFLVDTLPFMLLCFLIFGLINLIFPAQLIVLVFFLKAALGFALYFAVVLVFYPAIKFAFLDIFRILKPKKGCHAS